MDKHQEKSVTISQDATVSAAFRLMPGYPFIGALFPAMDDGDVGLEMSLDGGSNYHPALDTLDGSDVVLSASGADPGFVDFSDHVRFLPANAQTLLRFTCASQTTATCTVRVFFRG